MKVSELFVSDDDGKEDIMPWHYAKTAQGDNFGNPPYSKDVTNDLYDYCKRYERRQRYFKIQV